MLIAYLTISLLHSVQTFSGVYPICYPVCTGVLSPGVKREGCEFDHLHVMRRLRMMELYLYSPMPLHGVVLS
jgi:hypothetical protein